jgi:hypothetical protein
MTPEDHGQATTSWEACSGASDRLAASPPAHHAARAIFDLLDAGRKRSVTVQWMPDEHGRGCYFEVIRVRDGELLSVVRVDEDGRVVEAER